MTGEAESSEGGPEFLTLEPLIDAIREGVEGAGWRLSGLQKTTSQELEGRWAGDSSRSAYLFFHPPDDHEDAGIDVYLDEGRKGLSGNLALVLDGRDLGELGSIPALLDSLGVCAVDRLPPGYAIPMTLRLRADPRRTGGAFGAESEVRFKIRIPQAAIRAGAGAVSALSTAVVGAFESLLRAPAVEGFRLPGLD
jgi:hypothetical protein